VVKARREEVNRARQASALTTAIMKEQLHDRGLSFEKFVNGPHGAKRVDQEAVERHRAEAELLLAEKNKGSDEDSADDEEEEEEEEEDNEEGGEYEEQDNYYDEGDYYANEAGRSRDDGDDDENMSVLTGATESVG
jgi:hypothetical protein